MLVEKTFTDNDFSLNYAEGPQAGKPVVLLHGATLWWKDFQALFPSLTQNWHIYACDMRGHGKSSRMPGKYRVADFIPDIVNFVQQKIQEPVTLIGHSAGGLFAFYVAAQVPDMVNGIISLDPATIVRHTPILELKGPGDWVVGIGDVFRGKFSAKEFILASNPEIDEADLKELESMIHNIDPEFISAILNNTFSDDLDLEQTLSKVNCPSLLLYGDLELGSIVPQVEVDFLKQHLSHLIAYQIRGAGHSPHWEQTDTTIGYIRDFLKSL